jgi:hypothetical protein
VDENQAQLEWEARAGRGAAVAAFLSTACVIGTFVVQASIGRSASKKKADGLRVAHDHVTELVIYSVLTSLSFIFLSIVLLYLYRATRYRRPELPKVAAYTAVLGPVILIVVGIFGVAHLIQVANDFVSSGPQTEARAKSLSEGGSVALLQGLGFAGSITTGISIILISLNAMRAGLLSRFMGILGVIFGGLFALPIIPQPVIQLFWVGALGVLFIDRWPGVGRGPAWATGQAIDWPSAHQRAEEMKAARDELEPGDDDDDVGGELEPEQQRSPNARSRKRKKKR